MIFQSYLIYYFSLPQRVFMKNTKIKSEKNYNNVIYFTILRFPQP